MPAPDTPASILEKIPHPGPDGDEAWIRFVKLYTPLLMYWARRKGCQEADADDLVQEVFQLLVQKLRVFHYDPQKSFRSWLRTVCKNAWDNYWRRKGRPLPVVPVDFANVAGPEEESSGEEYRKFLVIKALNIIKDDFEETTWKIFQEYVMGGRPAAEVGARYGRKPGYVFVVKSQILSRLREEIKGLLD